MPNDIIKEHYDKEVPTVSGGQYEQHRWFKDKIQAVNFDLTKNSLEGHLLNNQFLVAKKILEIGPGPGTWTQLLLERFPDANFTLVDISTQMLKEAAERLSGQQQINFINADFADFKTPEQFDLIFSSRAIEYAEDKEKIIANISHLIQPGGLGLIITKLPHYRRDQLLGRKVPARHRRQISPNDLKHLLQQQGLTILGVYSVTVSVPLFHSARLNRFLGRLIQPLPLNFLTASFVESYAIKFAKQEVVEIFGLPAAGKTTRAKELEKDGYRLIKVRTTRELLKYNWQFCLQYPKLFWWGLFYFFRLARWDRTWYYKLMNLFFQHNAKFMKAHHEAKAVLDQGHYQNILSLFDRSLLPTELKKYLSILPRPDQLIVIDLSPVEREKRLNHRRVRPREELGVQSGEWQQAAEANFSTFIELLPNLGLPYRLES